MSSRMYDFRYPDGRVVRRRMESPVPLRVKNPREEFVLVHLIGYRKDDPVRARPGLVTGIQYRCSEYHLASACTCDRDAGACPCRIRDWRDIPTINPAPCIFCRAPAESFRNPPLALCYHCKVDVHSPGFPDRMSLLHEAFRDVLLDVRRSR